MRIRERLIKGAKPFHEYANSLKSVTLEEPSYPLPKPFNKPIANVTEADILKEMKQWLSYQKFFWRRMDTQGKIVNGRLTFSESLGFPDLLIITEGVTYFVEVKRPGGKLSQAQLRTLTEASKNGSKSAIVTSLEGLRFLLNGVKSNHSCEGIEVF